MRIIVTVLVGFVCLGSSSYVFADEASDAQLVRKLVGMGMECRGIREIDCARACLSLNRRAGRPSDDEVQKCVDAYERAGFVASELAPQEQIMPEPIEPIEPDMPDVVGTLVRGNQVDAPDREDWQNRCGSRAWPGNSSEAAKIEPGTWVRVVGISGARSAGSAGTSVPGRVYCRAQRIEPVAGSGAGD